METGVIIQEPIFTKASVEEAPAGVILDHSSMDVKKVNLSTVLDIIPGEAAEVVNGSGNKETEEAERAKGEAMKTVSVVKEEGKVVKEKASETEKDEQSFTYVHEPESFNKNREESDKSLSDVTLEEAKEAHIPPKPEEVSVEKPVKQEEEDSRTVETSVSVEETATEEETATNGESLLDVETKKRVLLEAEQDAEPKLDAKAKDETETIKTVIEDHGIVDSEESTVHESESSKEDVNSVEAVKNSDNAEQISREATVEREKEEDVTPKQEEVQEILAVNETPAIHGEDIEPKASKDTKEQEHVLVRDTPQGETVYTSTVQESPILQTLETRIDEPVSETSLDLKEVKEQEVETVKTVKSSDEVQESIVVDQISKETEAETLEAKEDTEPIVDLKEDKEQEETEKLEETPSDLALKLDKEEVKDDKINADQVDGGQIMEQQRGLDSKEPEAEQTDRNRTDETEEKMASHPVIETVKEIEKPSLEPPSEVSEETSKTIDEKIEEKPQGEEATPHQEGQEKSFNGLETNEEQVSVPKSIEVRETVLEERSVVDLTPLQDESSLRNEQEKETKLEKEQIEKHEEVKEDSVTAETSVNGTEIEKNATVSAEEISKNTVNETAAEDDHQGKNAETVEAIKDSDDAEIVSHDVATEREKEDDITRRAEEVQEIPTVIETPTIQGENTESEASNDVQEQEHVLVRDMPQTETIVTEAEAASTTPGQESEILKTQETTNNETEAGQVTKEDTEPSLDLKKDQETEKTGTVKPVISSDEVRPSDQAEESVEVKSKETIQDESSEEKHENLLDVPSEESEKFQDNESETVLAAKIPSDLALKVDEEEVKDEKTEVEKVDGTQLIEEHRGLDLTETEAEQTEGNRTDETEETSFEKVVAVEADEKITHDRALPDVESVEKMQNLSSLESTSEELGETSKTVDEKIDEAENNATEVRVEEISRNIVNETAPEDDDHQGEKAEPVVSGDREKEEDIAGITDEVQETPKVIETLKTEGDWSESKDSKDDDQHEHLLVRDMPQVETIVTEAETLDTSTVQESAILKTLETKTDETKAVQEESSEKDKNLLDEKTSVDQVDGTQIMEEQKGLHLKDPEAEQTDGNRTDETEVSPTVEAEETTHAQAPLDVESVETVQKRSLESPSEISEETSKTIDEKIEEKPEVEEVTQVSSSASPSEEREVETVVEDKKVDEEEQVADKIHQSLETVETVEPQSSLPSSSEEKEDGNVSEKIEEEKVEEEQKSEDDTTKSHERQEELSETTIVEAEKTRDIVYSLSEKISLDQTQAEEQVKDDEHVDSPTSLMLSQKSDAENLTAEAKKGDEETTVRHIPQGETIVTEAEPVEDTSTVQEVAILMNLETKIDETEAVHSPIGGEEESKVTKEDTKPSLDLKEDEEQEVTETVKSVILSDEVRSSDAQVQEIGEHTEHCSADIKDESQGREESVDVKPKEIIQKESTQEKDENILDVPSGESALGSASEVSEETSNIVDEKIEEKPEEEVILHQESQEEEKETELEKEQTEKHESTSEEDANAQQTLAAEKSDEVIQVSSASPSEEKESETVEAEKIGDIKENEEEQVADKIQRSLEPVEKFEPQISFPSPPEEDSTVAEGVKVKETEQVGDMSEKGLEVSETKDLSLPLEASRSDGTESSELVAESEEQKPKQVKETLEGERKEVDETKAETIPQETHSDVAKEEQTRDLHVEQEVVSSAELGETKTEEPEDEHVESSEKNDDETLTAETKKYDEDITVGLDGSGTKHEEEFEKLETPKLEESKEDKNQEVSETTEAVEAKDDHTPAIGTSEASQTPSFISELEDQIPKQIEEIHEEETKEARKVEATSDQELPVETSEAHQTKKKIEEIHEEETKAHELQEKEEVLPTEPVQREAPVSMLASGEDDQVAVQEGNSAGDTPDEEHHVSAETGESVGETKPKESEAEITEKSDDQIETSTKATKVEDEVTKCTDVEVAEITKEQSMPHAPENAPLKQEESKDLETPQHDVVKEEQSPLRNDNPDDTTVEAEHGDENSSSLPVVEILKGLQATLETERAINDSESTEENMVTKPEAQKTDDAEVQPETLEKNLATDISEPVPEEKQDEKVVEESPASEIKESNTLQQDESGETEKFQEVNVLEKKSLPVEEVKLQEEHKEEGNVQDSISREFEVNVQERLQEETRHIADQSLTKVVPGEKILIPSSDLATEESEHVVSSEKQEEVNAQKGANDSVAEPEQISLQEEKKEETHETVKEDQKLDIKEEKKIEEVQDEKVEGLSVTRDEEETFRSEMKKDKEDAINEVAISEKQITEPPSEAEKESNEEHVESQAISEDNSLTKEALDEQLQVPSTEISKPSELIQSHQSPKQVEEEDKNEKTVDALITSENVLVQDQSKDFEQDKKSNDLTYVQGENVTSDSVVAQKEATGLTEEKREVDYVKTELKDAIKHGVSIEEKNNESEKIDQEESKQTDIKEEIKKEDHKDTTTQETQECLNSIKNIDNAKEKTESKTREIESLSSVSNTQEKSKEEDEAPKLGTLKIAEELQQKDGEAENNKESEPTVNEPARKSQSDLIQKVKGTNKSEDAATKPHIEEELKTEDEDEDGDEHKDDKTSPDSIVMVEAKDTVNITKTQHKKSQGILSQVKHSISKVKKALTGKSSHTTKPSSPK